jgi:sugar phosphate isomerase/epimerase
MHDAHPLHPDPQRVSAARRHVRDTIEKAAAVGARRVLTVCGFGREPCDRPFERCVDFFAGVTTFARERGVLVLIEKLSRRRAGAMTGAEDLGRLFDELDAPDVFRTALDTGHILDDGLDPADYFKRWRHPVEEIQLRGPSSAPPAPDAPLRDWLGALPALPAVVCVEHREPIDRDRLTELVRSLSRDLGHAR